MGHPTVITTVPNAAWLPAGSTAEICGGTDLTIPEPTVIVRILLLTAGIEPALFVEDTDRGWHLPTQRLSGSTGRVSIESGLASLTPARRGDT